LFQVTGRPAQAEGALGRALGLLEKLSADFPAVPEYRLQLAQSSSNLGTMLVDAGRPAEAEKPLHRALSLYETRAAGPPGDHRLERATTNNSLGRALRAAGRPGEAVQPYRQALALWEELASEFPAAADHESNLGGVLHNLARLLNDGDDPGQARALAERAIGHQRRALKWSPGHPAYQRRLRGHYGVLAEALARLGRHAEAVRAAGEIPNASSGRWEGYPGRKRLTDILFLDQEV
jgi:tetratricopeptide (TPR) repeat protein